MASLSGPLLFNIDNSTADNSTLANGTSPNLYHHPHHGGYGGGSIDLAGVLVGILLPHAVCTLFVLARAGSRGILLRKWFLDDSLVVAAWLCSTAVCVVYSMSAVRSHGKSHDKDDNSALQDYLLRTYLGLIFYQLCLILTKLSILALYLRMFAAVYASEAAVSNAASSSTTLRRHHLRERRLAWITVAVVIAYGIPLLWMSIMQCYSSSSSSSSSSGTGPLFFGQPVAICFSFTPLLITSASLHTVTDAWLIVLVVPFVLTRLRFLPRSQRWALAAVLSLSIFVIAASLTRLQLSLRANWRPSMSGMAMTPTGPSRANTLGFFVMTILECDIALICASAPTLRPLLARLAPRLGLGDDHGPFDRRSGVSHRRRLFHPRGGAVASGGTGGQRHDEDSEDLTSVVSYHGYPWTRNSSPGRSHSRSRGRSMSRSQSQSQGKMEKSAATTTEAGSSKPVEEATDTNEGPSLPVPIFSRPYKPHRTPTDRSMRSQPRSLPQSRDGGTHGDSSHGTPLSGGGVLTRRPSSVFFFENSDFYDQYFQSPATTPGGGGAGPPPPTGGSGTKKAGVPGAGIGLGIVLHPRGNGTAESPRGLGGLLQRTGSQESFVMGLNDPASPTRLTRLTGVSGYSGETYTEEEGAERRSGGGMSFADLKKNKSISSDIDEFEMVDLNSKTAEHTPPKNKTETSFLDDDTDTDGDGQKTPKASPAPAQPTTPSNKPSPRV